MRDLFFKDFGWKLFSLLLAAFIWVTVDKIIVPQAGALPPANSSVTYGDLPVALVAKDLDPRRYSLNSNSVSVIVSGPSEVMAVLQGNQIRPTVDISGIAADPKNLDRRVDIVVPWGVTVQDVSPSVLRVVPPVKP
jgi:YbbR domain-containing protein